MAEPAQPRCRLRVWGARGTIPSPGPGTVRYGGHTSCLELRPPDGTLVVFDAGSGMRLLAESAEPAATAGAPRPAASRDVELFLTHRHTDHVIGLPFAATLGADGRAVRVRCGNGDRAAVASLADLLLGPPLFPPLDGLRAAITPCDFGPEGDEPVGAGCRVQALPARHPGGAAVLVLRDAQGPVVAYAPDNELAMHDGTPDVAAWRARLAAALAGVPLLLHDAHWDGDEAVRHAGWGHSSAQEATRFAIACGARTLVLVHHHPDRGDAAMDGLLAACRAIATEAGSALRVEAAREGMTLDVPPA
jgi:phosphoribosyl 1,2-cyclic phosphodiesterase